MTKVLITWVAWLVWTNFSRCLLDKWYEVIWIDDFSGGYRDFVDNRIKLYEMNLTDYEKLNEIFKTENIDYVYHFAAYAAEGLSPFMRRFNYTNNLICSVNIINNCINYNVKKLIFTSSMSVYGFWNPPFVESQQQAPIDPYWIAKYTVEQDIKQAHEQFWLRYTIIRPHNIIWIYQNIWDKYRNVVWIWIRQCINWEKISIFGDGEQKRAFSDIYYYMEPFEKVMTAWDSEIFNLWADQEYRIIDVANIVKDIAKQKWFDVDIVHYEARHEVKIAYSDHTKAKTMLDFKDGTDIRVLIEKMFDWALTQPKREVRYKDYEVEKNIYSFWKK